MKQSSEDTAREKSTQDGTDRMRANRIKRELRLKELIEQSSFGFYIGDWKWFGILRAIVVVGLVTFYILSDAFVSTGIWPLIAIAAILEAYRANRRVDAMVELEFMAEQDRAAGFPS